MCLDNKQQWIIYLIKSWWHPLIDYFSPWSKLVKLVCTVVEIDKSTKTYKLDENLETYKLVGWIKSV